MADRALPTITPETAHFWDGAKAGELCLQRCTPHGHVYFPPRFFCPRCGSRDIAVIKASGRAKLHSYIINHMKAPGFTPPFVVAVVELEEGVKMMANILGVEPSHDALELDMPLEVTFEALTDEISLPQWRPAQRAGE